MVGDVAKMLLPPFSNTITKFLPPPPPPPKKTNFVSTINYDVRRLRHVKKLSLVTVARFKKFVDYGTTNECQLCNFSKESVLGKTFNYITYAQSVV